MSDFGSWGQHRAFDQSVFSQVRAESERIRMLPVTLEPTSEPVWPEDEAREEAAGREVPPLAAEPDARELALHVRAKLPDRLQGCVLKLPPDSHLPTAGFDYYLIAVPTTFTTELEAQGITPRRLALELTLGDVSGARPPRIPVACYLYPPTETATEITEVGKFEIDLGKAVTAIWPGFPPVLTAKMGGSLDIKKVHARIQATGKDSRECGWLIADSVIAYDFNPSCIVQAPKGTQLSIKARLHVEVWKRVAFAFHRAYLIQATPMRYVLASSVSRGRLGMGSEVTFISPLGELSYTVDESREPGVIRIDQLAADPDLADHHDYVIAAADQAVMDSLPEFPRDVVVGPAPPGFGQSSTVRVGFAKSYAVVCRRGHVKDSFLLAKPSADQRGFCPECGAELLGCCTVCQSGISLNFGQPPKFCADCGIPFPWVIRPERF